MKKIFFPVYILLCFGSIIAMQHTNMLFPYEYILDSDRMFYEHLCGDFQINIRAEMGYNFFGYPVSEISNIIGGYNIASDKRNPLQYLNKQESILASFCGSAEDTWQGQFIEKFTPYRGVTASQILSFNGDIAIESFCTQGEVWITPHIKIGYYLPFYHFALQSLDVDLQKKVHFLEDSICSNIYDQYQKTAAAKVKPHNLIGMGDSECLISWQHYFLEERDFITAIFASIRTGLYIPSGMFNSSIFKTLLKIPFGYDSGIGIPFGGTIEIDVTSYFGCGINADCVTFFPSLKERAIKTDLRQTDMLLCHDALSLVNPGFRESFSVYATLFDENKTYLGTLAYQYNKQNDSDIILCNSSFSNVIAQSAVVLENWTNHNLIVSLMGFTQLVETSCHIRYELFLKFGLQGCRSIVGNSYGIQITIFF